MMMAGQSEIKRNSISPTDTPGEYLVFGDGPRVYWTSETTNYGNDRLSFLPVTGPVPFGDMDQYFNKLTKEGVKQVSYKEVNKN